MERIKFEYKKVSYSHVEPCPNDKDQEIHNQLTQNRNGKRGSCSITDYMLSKFGNEGWEMWGCKNDGTWNTYYFKRKLHF